jgi:hypothetical protein
LFIGNVQSSADLVCSRDALCCRDKSGDITDVIVEKFCNLRSGYTDTNSNRNITKRIIITKTTAIECLMTRRKAVTDKQLEGKGEVTGLWKRKRKYKLVPMLTHDIMCRGMEVKLHAFFN